MRGSLSRLAFALATFPALAGAAPPPPAVPAALTEVNPLLALRWSSLPLTVLGWTANEASLAPGVVAVASLTASAVVRIRGTFAAGCEPRVSRRFAAGDGWLDVPLPVERQSEDLLVTLPPSLGPSGWSGPGSEGEIEPAPIALALPAGCRPVKVRAFEASQDPDPFAGRRVIEELQQLRRSRPTDDELARWLSAPHPHVWQQEAALALALPRLLAERSSAGQAARDRPGAETLADGLLELATATLRTEEPTLTRQRPLSDGGLDRIVPGEDGFWRELAAGGEVVLPVADLPCVRLRYRAQLAPDAGGLAAWRLEAAFDDDRTGRFLAFAPADPEAPGLSFTRTRTLVVPPGARLLRVRAPDAAVLLQVVGVSPKPTVGDLFGRPDAARLLGQARARAGWPALLAAALLHPASRIAEPAARPPIPAALLALFLAQHAPAPAAAVRLLARVSEHLAAVETPLERAAASLIGVMVTRLQAELAVAADHPAEAVATLLGLAARRPLTDEDAMALLEADAFAQESLAGSPQALLAVDGLLARRPLDRALALARQRAFRGAARWQELSIDPGPRDVSFFDPLPASTTTVSPEHSLFSPVPPRPGRSIDLAVPPLPGQRPMLSLVALRAPGGPAVVRVLVDGVPHTMAAIGPFERVDVPARPGRHQVELPDTRPGTRLYTNFSTGDEQTLRLRRYLQVGETPVELHNRAVGPGELLLVVVRAVVPAGRPAPGPFELRLGGDSMRPVNLRVRPGSPSPDIAGDLNPEEAASPPIEALVPVATTNPSFYVSVPRAPPGVRILVHVSARRRAPAPAPVDPAPQVRQAIAQALALDDANLPAVAASSRRLDHSSERAAHELLARAVALTGLDEPTLAREDLVRSIAAGTLPEVARRLALTLWRHLDNVASSAHPATVDGRSAWVYAPGFGFVSEPVPAVLTRLDRLLDDRAALRSLDVDGLARAVGGGREADFAVLAAARQAERDGNPARAAELWHHLAIRQSHAGLFAQAGAARLDLPADPLNDAKAYVDLYEAARLDPHDPLASRLLRRAASRTRLRPVRAVEDSAGAVSVPSSADTLIPSVEAALMPLEPGQPGDLVTADSQLTLSFNLASPLSFRLNATARELRPEGARAVAASGVQLAWIKDGQNVHRVPCAAPRGQAAICKSGVISLAVGSHSLVVRLEGGLRPAARVAVESTSCGPSAACGRSTFDRTAEYLVARREQPIAVTLMGPTVVQAELRAPATGAAPAVNLVVKPARGPAAPPTRLALPTRAAAPRSKQLVSLQADRSRRGATDVSTMGAVVLERGEVYRVEVRPERGAVLCRLFVRDGVGNDAARPAPVPATMRASGPPPLLPPPDLERPLLTRVRDDDVAAGWEDFGSLGAQVGFRTGVDLSDQAGDVLAKSAVLGGLIYRRLIERLNLTLKLAGENRRWREGTSSQSGELEAYYVHPEARWARLVLAGQAVTQPVAGDRVWALHGLAMFEPIATLKPSVHLVNKLGVRLHRQPFADPDPMALSLLDPDIYTAHTQKHPRSLFWEEGIELAPLSNLLFYGGGRITTNPDFRLDRPDRFTINTVARSAFGRLLVQGGFRWNWYVADADRARALLLRTASLGITHTFWIGHLHALVLGVQAAEHIDLHVPELSVRLDWEVSNGRRLRDHTPVEDENYFYPQRGPGRESGRLLVGSP